MHIIITPYNLDFSLFREKKMCKKKYGREERGIQKTTTDCFNACKELDAKFFAHEREEFCPDRGCDCVCFTTMNEDGGCEGFKNIHYDLYKVRGN